jgi:hypothetical protein
MQVAKKIILLLIFTTSLSNLFSQTVADSEIKVNTAAITSPLQKLMLLEPIMYEYDARKYKHLKLPPGRHYGFISENMNNAFPDLVNEKTVSYMFGKNAYRNAKLSTVDNVGLVPILVASIKEQQQQIDELKAAIRELQNIHNVKPTN